MKKMGRKLLALFVLLVVGVLLSALVGCNGLRPNSTAGINIVNEKGSNPVILSGNNNTQAIPIYEKLDIKLPESPGGAQPADASSPDQRATASGVFVNANVGNRSSDLDATTGVNLLNRVKGASAGQTQTTSQGDESPTSGSQTQTPSQTQSDTTTIAVPVSVGQQGPSATAGQTVQKPEDSQVEQP